MITFPSSERDLTITADTLFLTDTRTLARRLLRPEPGAMLLAMIVFLVEVVLDRIRAKPPLATNVDLTNLSTMVSCRAADVPAPIRLDPAWPPVGNDAVVRVISKRSIRQVTLSHWTGMKVTTERDERVRFSVRLRHFNQLREVLEDYGYLPRTA